MRTNLLLLFLLLLFPLAVRAQFTSPGEVRPSYHFQPGSQLRYTATEEQFLDDPEHTARYTDEFFDSAVVRQRVNAVKPNGWGDVTLDLIDDHFIDRCRRIDENAIRIGHDSFSKSIHFIADADGQLHDSALVELTSSERSMRTGYDPKNYPDFDRSSIRHSHARFLPLVPRPPASAESIHGVRRWSDTENVMAYSGSISMSKAPQVSSSGKTSNETNYYKMTTIHRYSLTDTAFDGVQCSKIDMEKTVSDPFSVPQSTHQTTYYRAMDGVILYREEVRKTWTGGRNSMLYTDRQILRLQH